MIFKYGDLIRLKNHDTIFSIVLKTSVLENGEPAIAVLHANGLVFDYPEIYIRSFWILA